MASFVLEIGSEELPSRFLAGMEKDLRERFAAAFAEAGLQPERLDVCSTPRRAVVLAEGLASVQPEKEEVIMGPPARIAFGPDGKPGKAAEGFARTAGKTAADLFIVQTEKGEYAALRKTTGGRPTLELLQTVCPDVIRNLSFPKRMRWGSGEFAYPRPIRWILALLDDTVVSFEVGGVVSGRETRGHREHGPGPFTVARADDLLRILSEQGKVTPAGADRRALIEQGGDALAAAAGGRIIRREALLEEVQGLCEHPVPLLGDIDPSYLELPREVLLTSMEQHQKSFGLEDKDGNLLPHFLTVLNLTPPDVAVVKKGWERVLRARLEDARFFWKTDLESSFDAWRQSLRTVIFLAPLGSMAEKTERISDLCAWLARATGRADEAEAARAGLLSKADLVSQMVGEFDTLQGIMGGIYARRKGETENVAAALAEQYLPAGPDSPLPASELGGLLSIADKADTLAGCFGLGMMPTGAADPYALRRAALGIARIMLEKDLRFDVKELFAFARSRYGERKWKLPPEEALAKLEAFFVARVKNLFIAQGYETLLVEAVSNAQAAGVRTAGRRLAALRAVSRQPGFEKTVQAFKRAGNIIRKQGQGVALTGEWQVSLLREEAEKQLAARLNDMNARFEEAWRRDAFEELFALIAALQPAVDSFFDQVMVMCEDEALRVNRLNLLQAVTARLDRLADFSALQI